MPPRYGVTPHPISCFFKRKSTKNASTKVEAFERCNKTENNISCDRAWMSGILARR